MVHHVLYHYVMPVGGVFCFTIYDCHVYKIQLRKMNSFQFHKILALTSTFIQNLDQSKSYKSNMSTAPKWFFGSLNFRERTLRSRGFYSIELAS